MKHALRATLALGVAMLTSTASAQLPVMEARWGHVSGGRPGAIAVDDRSGDFYVIDTAIASVRRFDRSGRPLATWSGSGTSELKAPDGLAVDSRGRVWVADARARRVFVFKPDGTPVDAWEIDAAAIAIDRDDAVYIAERMANRVRKLDGSRAVQATWDVSSLRASPPLDGVALSAERAGRVVLALGTRVLRLAGDGALIPVLDLAGSPQAPGPALVNSSAAALAFDGSGRLYVLDAVNHRVLRFGSDLRLQRAWGGRGKARGSLMTLGGGIAVSAAGVVHISDAGNYRVQRFSADGALIDLIRGFAGERALNNPFGLTVDAQGQVYVADTRNHRIVKFSPDGELLARWGEFGREEGELQHPEGVAVDSDGFIYVADRGNVRIQKFDRHGAYVLQWSGPPRSRDASWNDAFSPHDVALGPHGDVYVLSSGATIYRFDRSGAPRGQWRFVGDGVRLAVDAEGNVYVTSTAQAQAVHPKPTNIYQVYKFDPAGTPLAAWGVDGVIQGRLNAPRALTIDRAGNIVVADAAWVRNGGGARVQTFDRAWTLLDAKILTASHQWPPQAMALDGRGHLFVLLDQSVARFAWPAPASNP
jgi:DNA-binding beta-propeller fold protein YncE